MKWGLIMTIVMDKKTNMKHTPFYNSCTTQDLRNELEIALTNHNKKFEQLTQQAVNCENEEEKKSLFQKRWQFIHDYAQFLNDFVWNHKESLTPSVTILFDLVPNTVWNRMSEKSERIIMFINQQYKQNGFKR